MDDGPRSAREAAPADRAADVGWEPADWDATLRKQRRTEWCDVIIMVVAFVVLLPVLQLAVFDDPLRVWHWAAVAWALLLSAHAFRSHFTVRGRERWDRQTRQEIRVAHALRCHESIGSADRERVTRRADEIDSWALAHFAGWPLGMVVLVAAILDPTIPGVEKHVVGLLVLFFAAQLLLACRRVREARRWLDDPLPRS